MRERSILLKGLCAVLLAAVLPMGLRGEEEDDPEGKLPASVKASKGPKKEMPEAYAPKGADLGKAATCPVDGKSLKVRTDTPALTYRGTVFFFDSRTCEAKFLKDPEAHLPAARKP